MNNYDLKETTTDNRLRGLWRLMHGYRLTYVAAVLGVGLGALARTGMYVILGRFVDDVLPSEDILSQLPWVALAIIGLAVVQGVLQAGSGRLAARTSEGVVRRLRDYLYDHIQRLTFSFHDKMQTGELLQRSTSDVDAIRRLIAEQAIGFGRITLVFLVNFIALALINLRLALISIVVIPPVLVVSLYFFVKIGQKYEEFQTQEAKLTNRLQENLSGVRVVKAFARQAYEIDKFGDENTSQFQKGTGLTKMHALYWPSTDILCGGQTVLSLFVAGTMVLNGTITTGELIASTGFVVQIIWPIRQLGRLIADMSTGLVSFGRIRDIIRVDREPLTIGTHAPDSNVRGHISFRNVSFAYEGEEAPVLHNITFDVYPGQTIALLGSTGSGKTSLVNLLPRFYEYTDGEILLDGVELKTYSREYLRSQIGVVHQESYLFATTLRDNITYGVQREVSDAEVAEAARSAAVHDVILGFPDGYKTLVGERGVTLSGGQKQRTALARTILQNPRILILDDATSAVDTETESVIRDALQTTMTDRTTFVIAHRIQSVMDADLILVMDKGHVIESGAHSDLMAQHGVYRRIYDLQASIESDLQAELDSAEEDNSYAVA